MSIIVILAMMFVLSVIAATLLFALIRITQPHKRKIYPYQTVKHGADKLPYQLDNMQFEQVDTGDWVLNEVTGKYTQTLWDGTVVTWKNDPSGQVRVERQNAEVGAANRNAASSDRWMGRVNG